MISVVRKIITLKSTIFWDITSLNVNRRFGGTYYLHLQGRVEAEGKSGVNAGGKH
jgi:hypothetical protein